MNIEKSIFIRCKLKLSKLLNYGFIKEKDVYKYQKKFLDDDFLADISIKNLVNKNSYYPAYHMNKKSGLRLV